MKLTTIVAFAILLGAGTLALANTQQTEDKVRKVIEASLKGECSDILNTMIKSACESQLASSTPGLSATWTAQGFGVQGIRKYAQRTGHGFSGVKNEFLESMTYVAYVHL
ncbi:hypothetical protein J3P91_14270 [Pseudomonas sp. Z4-7]|uniref:hypothetical protein n=1 Tax=Pseudomonas sp. Z4-7 TaxID=2817413 RepID=UPI003DA7AFB0